MWRSSTLPIDDGVSLTATVDILKAIAGGKGPDRAILALGYAGWRAGQLESEIAANGWLHCPADRRPAVRPRPRSEVRAGAVEDRHRSLPSRQRGGPRLSRAGFGRGLTARPLRSHDDCRRCRIAVRVRLLLAARAGRELGETLGDGRRQAAELGLRLRSRSLRRQRRRPRHRRPASGRGGGPVLPAAGRRWPVRSAPCGRRRWPSASGGTPGRSGVGGRLPRRAASAPGPSPIGDVAGSGGGPPGGALLRVAALQRPPEPAVAPARRGGARR